MSEGSRSHEFSRSAFYKPENIPPMLKDWRMMSHAELEEAFERAGEEFKTAVVRELSRTETNLQGILPKMEQGSLN